MFRAVSSVYRLQHRQGILLGSDSGLRGRVQSALARIWYAARLGQESPADPKAARRNRAKGEERRAVAGLDHDNACERRRQRRSDALRGDDEALRDVEPPGVAHEIGD